MSKTIHTSPGGELTYVDDLITALEEAQIVAEETADASDNPAVFFYCHDQEGRPAQHVKVTCDTLTDGSKAYNIEIVFGF
jgi:hypothetical protein